MAEWAIEGLLRRLILKNGPELSELRRRAVFFVVPNANPDGSFRDFTRTSVAGRDLNRSWGTATGSTVRRPPEEPGEAPGDWRDHLYLDAHPGLPQRQHVIVPLAGIEGERSVMDDRV